jgi:DNA-binding IclR family transcriptional regulator
VTLKEISEVFGYPASSASGLLKSMLVMGYLDYDRYSRTYMPTMRIATLGTWISGSLFGEGQIMALVKHMSEATQETVAIATQSDLFMQYIHVEPSLQAIRYHFKPGIVRPLARSGLGWLLLSARSDDVVEKVLRRINADEQDRKKRVALTDLMANIREIRKQGYVHARNVVTPGAAMIGALLPERSHGRIFVIGISGPVERLDEKKKRIVTELKKSIAFFLKSDRDS